MTASILHRISGGALTVAGLALLTWWLAAIAGGDDSYDAFAGLATGWFGILVLMGLSWAFFQHLLTGIRHLFMDSGAGFELATNKRWALATIAGAIVLTILFWAALLGAVA